MHVIIFNCDLLLIDSWFKIMTTLFLVIFYSMELFTLFLSLTFLFQFRTEWGATYRATKREDTKCDGAMYGVQSLEMQRIGRKV